MPQLAWNAPSQGKIFGELTTGAKPSLDGGVGLVSQFILRTSVHDHIQLAAEISREQGNQSNISSEIQRVDADVTVSHGDWYVGFSGGALGETEGDGDDGSQHLAASSRHSGSALWDGRVDFHESCRSHGEQVLYKLDQNLTHDVGRRQLNHQMQVQRWDGDVGRTATSAGYSVFVSNQGQRVLGLSGHWSSMQSGDVEWDNSEIRVSGEAEFAGEKLRVASQVGVNRHQQNGNLVHKHRVTAQFGSMVVHAQYDRDAEFRALDSTQLYGTHFRDPLVPNYYESFFQNHTNAAEVGMEVDFFNDWSSKITVLRRQESADLVSELEPERFLPAAHLVSTRGRCVLENRNWAGRLSLDIGRESNDTLAFSQTEIAYAQDFCPFVDRAPAFSVMVRVARQPGIPAWWLLSEMPWDPRNGETFYAGHLRMVF